MFFQYMSHVIVLQDFIGKNFKKLDLGFFTHNSWI